MGKKIKAGSPQDKMMESKMGIKPGSKQDKKMESGMVSAKGNPMGDACLKKHGIM